MRKTYAVLVVSFIIATITTNAQTEKKEPPPPPPKPKEEIKYEIVKDEKVKVPPVVVVSGENEFYTRNSTVSEISRQGNIITIKKKDGTTEKYDMNKKEENKSFTDKYGRSPIPPPPPKIIKTKSRA